MRRYLVLGIVGTVLFFGVGGFALWSLLRAVAHHQGRPGLPGTATHEYRAVRAVTAVLVSADGRGLTATTDEASCGRLTLHADESDSAVRLAIDEQFVPGIACALIERFRAVHVRLTSPVGTRELTYARSSDLTIEVPSFDARDLLTLRRVPAGLRPRPTAAPFPTPAGDGVAVDRGFRADDGSNGYVRITQSTGTIPPAAPRPTRALNIGGNHAAVYDLSDSAVVQWSSGPMHFSVLATRSSGALALAEQAAAGLYP